MQDINFWQLGNILRDCGVSRDKAHRQARKLVGERGVLPSRQVLRGYDGGPEQLPESGLVEEIHEMWRNHVSGYERKVMYDLIKDGKLMLRTTNSIVAVDESQLLKVSNLDATNQNR